nr:MAG TPA: hypothetical protein [Caudoviricetes sp.]
MQILHPFLYSNYELLNYRQQLLFLEIFVDILDYLFCYEYFEKIIAIGSMNVKYTKYLYLALFRAYKQ